MRIDCQQTILMKYHALFVIFEKAAKFEIVVCCIIIGGALRANSFPAYLEVFVSLNSQRITFCKPGF